MKRGGVRSISNCFITPRVSIDWLPTQNKRDSEKVFRSREIWEPAMEIWQESLPCQREGWKKAFKLLKDLIFVY